MFSHLVPPDLSKYVKTGEIKDDLISTDADKPLSAGQGKILKDLLDSKSNVVSGVVHGSTITLSTSNEDNIDIDVSSLVIDTKAMSGHYDSSTQALVISLNDDTAFSIPVASLLPVLTGSTIDGDGSGIPLQVALSKAGSNMLSLDSTGKLLAPREVPSSKVDNILTRNSDGKLEVLLLDEVDMHSESTNNPPSQKSVKLYVDALHKARVFLSTDIFHPSDENNPTIGEVLGAVSDREVIVLYTKSSNENDYPLYSWHIDKDGKVTILNSPKESNYVMVNVLTDSPDEIPTTHAVTEALPDSPIIAQVANYIHRPISAKTIKTDWVPIAQDFDLEVTTKFDNSSFRVTIQWFGESAHTEDLMMGIGINSDDNIEGDRAISMPTKTYDYHINNKTTPEIGKVDYVFDSSYSAGHAIKFVPLMKFTSGKNTVRTNRTLRTGSHSEKGISSITVEEIRR